MSPGRGERPPETRGEDEVAALYRLAAEPKELPEAEVEAIRRAARESWRRRARRDVRSRRLRIAGATLAAAAIATVAAVGLLRSPATPSVVGSIRHAAGEVRLAAQGAAGNAGVALEGAGIPPGAVLSTGADGRLALALAPGGSLRLDHRSRVRIESPRRVVLEAGALYFDSADAAGAGLEVATPLGTVTDVGTRFEVRLLAADAPAGAAAGAETAPRLRIRVRDGLVRVDAPSGGLRAGAGSDLLVTAAGATRRARLAADAEEWRWAESAAPVPAIEGRSLAEFLDWSSREMGLGWRLGEPRPALAPEETVLHGSVEGLTPRQATETVLRGSGLRQQRVGGELVVTAAGP